MQHQGAAYLPSPSASFFSRRSVSLSQGVLRYVFSPSDGQPFDVVAYTILAVPDTKVW